MMDITKLDRLLTQVNCRITSIARLREAGTFGWRGPMKAIPEECRTYAMVCSRLAEAGSDDRSHQFGALAKTWLEVATQLEISEALLGACSIVSERKVKQELKQAVEFRAELMRQIDCQNFAFDA